MSMQTGVDLGQSRLSQAVSTNWVLIAVVMLHFGIATSISFAIDVPFESGMVSRLITLFGTLVPTFLTVLLFWKFFNFLVFVRPDNPTRRFLSDSRMTLLDPYRLNSGLIAFLIIALFLGSFSFLKDNMPLINPFSWDPAFAELDRMIHFNRDPYALLMPVLGTPLVTTFINAAYHFWFFLLFFLLFVSSFDRTNLTARNTFLTSFVLCFAVGGNLLATLLSSAGPVYYSIFGYGPDFEPLLDRLHEFADVSPVWALNVHEMLLDGYRNDGPVKGISAMPSMHVASSVLMAFYAFTWRRWAGWLLTAFAFVIMLGSVHLAWHYAVDGYFGALIAWGCWRVAGKLEGRTA